jgi:hypothetical protein
MRQLQLAGILAMLGKTIIDEQTTKDQLYLESHGWICLGAEAGSGEVHWTNLERGIGQDGPVTFQRALWIQATKDAVERMK